MDLQTGLGKIAAGCTTCGDLDGFLRYILAKPSSWTDRTGVLKTTGITGFEPDLTVAEVADAINDSGYPGGTSSMKILPDDIKVAGNTKFSDLYGKVTDYVDQMRATVGDAAISTHLSRSAQAMNQVVEGRRVSQVAGNVRDLQAISKSLNLGFTIMTDANGNIDTEATLKTNSNPTVKASTLIKKFFMGDFPDEVLKNANVKKYINGDRSHNAGIVSAVDYLNRLATALPCTGTGTKRSVKKRRQQNHGRMLAKARMSPYPKRGSF